MKNAFERFYKDGHHPEDAIDLAISDARANKLGEFESALIAYRDQRNDLRAAVERLLPFAEARASMNEITGWASDAHSAVDSAKKALRPKA